MSNVNCVSKGTIVPIASTHILKLVINARYVGLSSSLRNMNMDSKKKMILNQRLIPKIWYLYSIVLKAPGNMDYKRIS